MRRLCAVMLGAAIGHLSSVHGGQEPVGPSWPAPTNYVDVSKRLVSMGGADALATAALVKAFGMKSDNGALDLARRGIELAPAREDLVWLAARLCANAEGCDPAIYEERLQKVDPRNGAAWLGALARARAGKNEDAVNEALKRIAGSQRLDLYFNSLIVATTRPFYAARQTANHPNDPAALGHAVVEMAGMLAGTVLPPFQPLGSSCREDALRIAGRIELCRAVARVFEQGDTFIAERVGLDIEQGLSPVGSKEAEAVAARSRSLQYRFEEWTRLSMDPARPTVLPPDYLDVLQQHEREQDVAVVYLTRAGIALEPPKAWVSSLAKGRS